MNEQDIKSMIETILTDMTSTKEADKNNVGPQTADSAPKEATQQDISAMCWMTLQKLT